ncbi:unnamed protein product [Mycena citricolor]|uniref:Uncharacterized protein n=1 Tax=Mycena citricolor TaxID=2018698 RepID=A0AAD2HGF4_9AGAR|nr:unnamed protein product [Mycena citricolor]
MHSTLKTGLNTRVARGLLWPRDCNCISRGFLSHISGERDETGYPPTRVASAESDSERLYDHDGVIENFIWYRYEGSRVRHA